MSHRAVCVPCVHVPRSHLCPMELYVSLGTGMHRCPMEPSTFCGPVCVPWSCRCSGSNLYPTNLWMLHGAIHTPCCVPSMQQLWQQPSPGSISVLPPKSTQSPTSMFAVPKHGWFPSQPCSRLFFMAHPDPLQSGCFAMWLNRLWLQPWEEGQCPPCDYTPTLTT